MNNTIMTSEQISNALLQLKSLLETKITNNELSVDYLNKINKIITNGDGLTFLSNNGTYKTIPNTVLTADELSAINTISNTGDGSLFLSNNGEYKASLTPDQLALLTVIIKNGDGSNFLASDGIYKTISANLSSDQLSKINTIVNTEIPLKYILLKVFFAEWLRLIFFKINLKTSTAKNINIEYIKIPR